MTAITVDMTHVKPICPHKTSDIVRLLREVSASLKSTGVELSGDKTLVEYVSQEFCKALAEIDPSIVLLMVQQLEITDPLVLGARPDCKVTLRFVPYDEIFSSVDNAVAKVIRREIGSVQSILDEHDITLLASLVLTNTDDSRGQLSHPIQLREEIEHVAQSCISIPSEHQVRFLEVLETSSLNAQRKGATIAAVAVQDVVDSSGSHLQFQSFVADSEDHYKEQELEKFDSATCMWIHVRQHDVPR